MLTSLLINHWCLQALVLLSLLLITCWFLLVDAYKYVPPPICGTQFRLPWSPSHNRHCFLTPIQTLSLYLRICSSHRCTHTILHTLTVPFKTCLCSSHSLQALIWCLRVRPSSQWWATLEQATSNPTILPNHLAHTTQPSPHHHATPHPSQKRPPNPKRHLFPYAACHLLSSMALAGEHKEI